MKKKTIKWYNVNPYDIGMMHKIFNGIIKVDTKGQPKYDPYKCSLFKDTLPPKKKNNKG